MILSVFIILLAENRPKVALVLSGGGAKGIAQIPTLQLIDSLNIPIDIVVGTSMGAINGAVYAIGYSPDEIIEWLVENDVQNNPGIRQYGVVDLIDGGRSAAFTGENCSDYKNHITGDTYAIQGNILLGQEILDDMEIAFLSTFGTMDEKLLASMQAANVPGADTRCMDYGIPALSAFIVKFDVI